MVAVTDFKTDKVGIIDDNLSQEIICEELEARNIELSQTVAPRSENFKCLFSELLIICKVKSSVFLYEL